jgi:hypothetical protein
MGILHGVQPPVLEDGVDYYSMRTGDEKAPLLWFKAVHIISGLSVNADELSGQPGVMSFQRAAGDAGKARLKDKIAKLVEEFT